MPQLALRTSPPMLIPLLFLLTTIRLGDGLINKEQQTLVPQELDASIKCGSCPCTNPCAELPPPPPPPPPMTTYCPPPPLTITCCPLPPPPPRFIYFTEISPPPPRFVYVSGIPAGNVYVTDPYEWTYYDGTKQISISMWVILLVGFGVLGLIMDA